MWMWEGALGSFIKKAWPQALAGALMAAPAYFNITHNLAGLLFYGLSAFGVVGLILEIAFETRTPSAGKRHSAAGWIGIVCGAAILGAGAWFFWPMPDPPPLGALALKGARMEMNISVSTGQAAGQIIAEIENTTDKLIFFHATTAGNINGMPFDENKIQFDGYVDPHKTTLLMSNRLVGFKLVNSVDLSNAAITGIYEYDLRYRYADGRDFVRHSFKGIKITQWGATPIGKPGERVNVPTNYLLYKEIEE